MFTVTFYSYKGGVGRTSALMNVATRLAKLGRRVCVLDFDLEAPGLDSFGLSHPAEPMAGVVEYITEFLATGKIPDIRGFVYKVSNESRGALYLIPAGRKDSEYQHSLSRLDWKLLYKQKNGALIVEALKRVAVRDLSIDYFLIDSRTGLTDVAGIATLQLPNVVVMLFNLNEQNIKGTAQVLKSIRENRLNRMIKTLLVASPIPELPEFLQMRSTRFKRAQLEMGDPADLVIPYDPFVCFQEAIVDEHQSKALSKSYDDLTNKIVSLNESDVINMLRQAREYLDTGEVQLAELKYQEVLDLYPTEATAWFQYGRFARIKGDNQLARTALLRALEIAPNNDAALGELALTELQLGNVDEARKRYLEVINGSRNVELLNRISRALADKGEPQLALEGMSRMVGHTTFEFKLSNAEMATRAGRFEEASEIFEQIPALGRTLAVCFNAGYAAFKAKRDSWRPLLAQAIAMFEATDMTSKTPRDAANIYGAIAFAYHLFGNTIKERDCLNNALKAASSLDEKMTIFCFPKYEHVSKGVFIENTVARLATVDKD